MPHHTEISANHEFYFEMDTDSPVPWPNVMVDGVIAAIRSLHAAVPLASFAFATPAGEYPDGYDLRFLTQDGREWHQVLLFNARVSMNFATDFFTLEEFVPHREVRDRLVALVRTYRLVNLEWRPSDAI